MKQPAILKTPCHENWETMKIGLDSRFCENCQKNVIDFTKKDKKEILEYLLSAPGNKVCGRIYPSQLDFNHTDLMVVINALGKQHKNSNLSFYLLTVAAMMLASCNDQETILSNDQIQDIQIVQQDTMKRDSVSDAVFQIAQKNVKISTFPPPHIEREIVDPEPPYLTGEIGFGPGDKEPYDYVEFMPEFKGGMDSLISYIQANLHYPKWEQSNKIEGQVFAQFIVTKTGKIQDAKIIRSVKGSVNLDKEVLRVINEMPVWKPGSQYGVNYDVRFTLPLNFKL